MFTVYMLAVLIAKMKAKHGLKVTTDGVTNDAGAMHILKTLWQGVTRGQVPLVKAADLVINTYIIHDHDCDRENCPNCVFLNCQFEDSMHYHHDGCPS